MTSLCSTFAFADADLVVKSATISNGNGTMQVVINSEGKTAFQFDVKLPAGVSATAFGLNGAPESRQFEKAEYDKTSNTWRFLSYDNGNATFEKGTTFNITLTATEEAEGGQAQSGGIVLVDPEGEGPSVDGGNFDITVERSASITIGGSGKTTFVSTMDLDFSTVTDVKAYIAIGYDLVTGDLWLTRVKDVPAKTPIWVTGPKNTTKSIPAGKSTTYYPENLLRGNAKEAIDIPAEDADFLNWVLMGDGKIAKMPDGVNGYPAGKAYLHLPKAVSSSVGTAKTITLGDSKKTTLVYDSDLDFSSLDKLQAYIVTGYAQDGTIWLTRVKTASAGTPLYLKGDVKGEFTIPSSEQKISFVNMLQGDAASSVALTPTTDDMTNYVLYGDGNWGKLTTNANYPAGKAYLPVPTAYIPASARGMNGQTNVLSENETEVIVIKLGSASGDNDGTTSIRSIDEIQSDDVWYNLKGQRIDTPTKKGLYIKNGKKVVVK
jgi:hypothetical protein